MRSALSLPVLLLAGCALPTAEHEPHEVAAYEAVVEAWAAAGLPEPSNDCHLDLFQVHQARTAAEYPCGDPAKSYGCMTLENYGGPMRPARVPEIYITPWHHSEPYLIVHELLHGFAICSGLGYGHGDPRVWQAAGGASSVQEAANQLLRDGGWL